DGGTVIQATGVTTGRWIRIFAGPLSVKWFGAKGDASTDDTTAIQRAIQALPSGSTYNGGTIWFPPGDYRFKTVSPDSSHGIPDSSNGIQTNGKNVIFQGSGIDVTILTETQNTGGAHGIWVTGVTQF